LVIDLWIGGQGQALDVVDLFGEAACAVGGERPAGRLSFGISVPAVDI